MSDPNVGDFKIDPSGTRLNFWNGTTWLAMPDSIETRVSRIEAIMLDLEMHEPFCPIRDAQRSNESGGSYFVPCLPCNCWLTLGPEVPDEERALTIRCPECNSNPRSVCMSPSKERLTRPHKMRIDVSKGLK